MKPAYTRRNERVMCGVSGHVQGPRGAIRGTIRNLSKGGSFFLSDQVLPIGQAFEMHIDLPGIPPVKALAEVRYHYRYTEGGGMGIRFLRLSSEDLQYIGQFVDARVGNA